MANLLTNLFKPFQSSTRPTEPVEKAATKPAAMGAVAIPTQSLKEAIGQPQDNDFSILYGLYRFNADVSASVHKWAGGVTSPGWKLQLMDPDAIATDKQQKQLREITTWLRRPNPKHGMRALLYTVVQHLAINGDAFWYVSRDKKGMPLEIWPMHPALTRVAITQEGEVLGYVMTSPGNEKIVFKPEEVIHFQLPNPNSDVYGEGRVELLVEEAGIDLQALRSNKSIFINGLSPSALILLDDQADSDDAKSLTDTIRQGHTGADNRNKLLALARVRDFKPYSISPKEMDFLGLRKLATEKVTAVMGVPKVLLGNHNSGDYATTKFLVREMHQNVFEPVQAIISEIITEDLIHSINPDFEYVLNKPDASDPDVLRKDQMAAAQQGILTNDEVRRDSFGKDPLDEEIEPEKPAPKEQPSDAPGDLDENHGNSDDAPDDVEATKSIHKAAEDDIDPLAIERDELMAAMDEELVDPIADHFQEQEDAFLARLPEELTDENLVSYVDSDISAFDAAFALLLGSLLYKPLLAGIDAAKHQLYDLLGNNSADNLRIDMSLRFDQVNPVVQQYIQTDAFNHVKGINETTRNQLRATLAEGLRNGEGIEPLRERIENVFESARGYRARSIARTETAQAFQHANHEAGRLLFEDGLVKYRRWMTAPEGDTRICEICLPLNGYVIRFDAKYPDDLEPTRVHPQCRCTESYMVGDEEELEEWRRVA